MSEIHLLNVGEGDCTIFKSNKDHITIIDICNGNAERERKTYLEEIFQFSELEKVKGNFGMCQRPTNPLDYLARIGVKDIFRFILTHPDMDHLDGLDNLMNEFNILNFWDSGVKRDPPDFSTNSKYKEEDWDRYISIIEKRESITVVTPKANSRGKYFNEDDEGGGGDFLFIYAPSQKLVDETNKGGDINDASYVILYNTAGGRILIPGDAHDNTWDYILATNEAELKNCEFLLAPHHGRDSNRDWTFLDKIKPKLSLLGCADSKFLAYNAWNSRGLDKIMQNQSGNMVLYPNNSGLDVYVENEKLVEKVTGNTSRKDSYGNIYLYTIEKDK